MARYYTQAAATMLFLFLVGRAEAQLNRLASTVGGSSYEVCLHDGRLYVGAANTLITYTLNGPNHTPDTATDSIRLPSNIDQVLVHNGFLYVCANHAGLFKYDISAPNYPAEVGHYKPVSIDESIYDVAFRGDSLIVAAKHKLQYFKDSLNTLIRKSDIFTSAGDGRIHGVDIKDNLMAFTLGFSSQAGEQGVYLYDLNTLTQLDFYNQIEADAWEVYFGTNTPLLHVMGGNYPLTLNGLYYAMDYTNPNSLQLAFKDTISGALNSLAMPMSAEIIHDTIYIATQGAVRRNQPFPVDGEVYVYDATNPGNIHFIADIYAGLYHFDIEIDDPTHTMYVASEWYGVLTMDIDDIQNEVKRGQRLTGGWCHGSAFARDRLAEANEGYGMRLFDMSIRQNPTLIAEDTTVGFCRAISMDDSAQYVYGWYLTGQKLRIFDARNGTLLANVTSPQFDLLIDDWQKSRIHGNRIAVIEDPTSLNLNLRRIFLADISIPTQGTILAVRNKPNLEELLFLPSGELVALATDSLMVLNPNDLSTISALAPPFGGFQPFKGMAYSHDTLYIFYEGLGEGIARYHVHPTTHQLSYVSAFPFQLHATHPGRIHMATDDTLLYIATNLDSLQAVQLHPPHDRIAVFDHGADFMYDNIWGVHDLYYSQDLLVLNEYMGQSTIFGQPTLVSITEPEPQLRVRAYPNPTGGDLALKWDGGFPMQVAAFDMSGRRMAEWVDVHSTEPLDASTWPSGVYALQWRGNQFFGCTRIVVQQPGH